MSIKPVLSFRGVFVGAIAVVFLGIAAFAFGESSYSSVITQLFTAEAAGPEKFSQDNVSTPAASRNGESQPNLGGANGRLVFGRFTEVPGSQFSGRVGTIEPSAGSPATTLTSEHEFEPAWSPDGKKIVFISMRDGIDLDWWPEDRTNREIYIMNADGTDQRRLTFNLSPEAQPVFSPDGNKILYVGMVNGDVYGDSGVFSMNLDGSGQTLLFDENCITGQVRPGKKPQKNTSGANFYPGVIGIDTPNYAPDMSNIIFSTGFGSSRGVYRHQVGGTGCSLVVHKSANSIEPRYSPDGTKIAVNGNSFALEILDPAGNLITGYNPPGYEDYSTPIWSTDNTKIAYLADMGDWGPTTVRVFDLTTQTSEIVYPAALDYFYNGLSWGTPTTVVPPITLALTPYAVSGGQSLQGTIQMDPATFPAGGGTVNLSIVGSAGILTLPQTTVTIPPGSTSAPFTINTLAQLNYNSADVVASYQSSEARATVTVRPPKPDLAVTSLTAPANVALNTAFSVTWTVQNVSTSSSVNGYRDEFFYSRDNQWDASDVSIGANNFSALAGGAQRTQSRNLTITSSHNPENGTNYIIVVTNRGTTPIDEGGSTANNVFVRSVQMALADIVAENLVVPAQSEPNVPYTLTWTLRNQGTISTPATNPSFQSEIYFSSDNIAGNADDIVLFTESNTTLAAGATAARSRSVTIPTVPVRASGPSFFYIKVDAFNVVREGASTGEMNNNTFGATQFDYRVADLQVTASSMAPDIDTDTSIPFSWTTANVGNKAAPTFSDRVFLSTDAQVGGDTELGTFALTGGLAEGGTADRIQNFTIATASIPASGTYYIYVQTDATGAVNEGANENNNTRFQSVYIRKALRPDLVVSNVTGPPTVFFDQTIQVQWTVTNSGAGPTNAPQWKDRLYLSTSSTSTSGATLLVESNSITALNPGESYTSSATVKIPRGINGAYHFIVRSNSNNAVNETSTANNQLSSAVQVNVPPLPDLTVESVQAVDEVFAGQEISINYTIRNIGNGDASYHKDRIYFSRDTTLNTSQDRLVFTSDGDYGPLAGQATTHIARNRIGLQNPPVYQTARVPSDIQGLWYVFVVTDYANNTYEYTAENNNTNYDSVEPGAPVNVLVTPPDLVVPNEPTAPATAASGGTFAVNFTVRNQGAFNAAANLYHAVYLSADQTFNRSTDTFLGTFKDPNFFAAGAEHAVTINVGLPYCLTNGTYYLFAVADYDGRQFEFDPGFDAEANNASPPRAIELSTVPPDLQVTNLQVPMITMPGQSVALTWTVANLGGASTHSWSDRVVLHSTNPEISAATLLTMQRTGGLVAGASYTETRSVVLPAYMEGSYYISVTTDYSNTLPECGAAELNNSANSNNFSVQNNLPDLVIDSVNAPSMAVVGDSFNVQWAGRNANQAMPGNSPSWRDNVYLSTNTTFGGGDHYIGSALNSSPLAGGQTYSQQAAAAIGNIAPGTYYVLVVGDGGNNIYEGTSSSTYETNNVRASAPITLSAPPVDLQVSGVTLSTPHYSGTYRSISWTVTNTGASQTLASSWTDYVYISRDAILDPTDTQLGHLARTGVLAGGSNYVRNATFFIPTGLTGAYNIFVVTDKNNSVVESNNSNNTSAPLAVELAVPPPAELSITNITLPPTISVGANATFSWTVQNTGANPVEGQWRDTFYLSRDQFWDASDTLVGLLDRNSETTSVPAGGGTYTSHFSGATPPVEEGTYYVIVRTDAQNRIRESNEANNVTTSIGTTTVTITELQLNTPFNTTLGNGAQQFFKYATEPAETLLFTLTTDKPARSNEAFTKFGTMVSRANYDFQSQRPGEGNQENVIDTTQDGDYYSMVRTDFIPQSFADKFDETPVMSASEQHLGAFDPQNITVTARILPFSVRQVSPSVGGNQGDITLVVDGAKFEQGATVKLVGSGGQQITPRTTRVAQSKIAAIFDLKGKPLGDYDVVVTNPDKQTAQLEDGFEIVPGTSGGHSLGQSIVGPNGLRGGFTQRVRYTFTARNDGLNDAHAVPIIVSFPSNVGWELDRSNFYEYPAEMLPADAVTPLQLAYEFDGRTHLMLIAPILRSRSSIHVKVDLTVPGSGLFNPGIAVLPPLLELLKDVPPIRSEAESLTFANGLPRGQGGQQPLYQCYLNLAKSIALTMLNFLPGANCADEVIAVVAPVVDFFGTAAIAALTDTTAPPFDLTALGGYLISMVKNVLECAGKNIPWLKMLDIAYSLFQTAKIAVECLNRTLFKVIDYIFSADPNDKNGPAGYGAERFVPVRQPMLYRIRFENVATATAPAARISITDVLPPTLDPRTVRLTEIGFKQYRVVVPENQAFYQSRIQLGPDLNNIQADILAGLDLVNNRIFWNLQAIDPQTGDVPVDPLLGLLPPNNANRDGEGYVLFTVEPTSTMPTGTQINNSATIIFDANEPIITNVAENQLDSGIPTSQMSSLPATSTTPSVDLSWSGNDDATGSGLSGFDIFSSEDGAAYLPVLNNTTDTDGTLDVNWGKTYRFYSRARDNAGNVEPAPTQPDATITILGGDTEADLAPRPNGNDGVLDASDTDQVRRFVAGLDISFTYNEFQRADMSPRDGGGNGTLSVADIMQSRRFVGGLDLKAEAAGPNEPSGLAPKAIPGKSAAMLPRELKVEKITRVGNQILVAIMVEAQGDETGLGFTLNFDPAVLSNPVPALGSDAGGATLAANMAFVGTGKLGIIIDKAPANPLAAGTKQVLTVAFDVAPGAPMTTQFTFGSDPVVAEVVNGTAASLSTLFSPSTISLSGPTAAGVSISGRVAKQNGDPLRNARVTITDANGARRNAISSAFGYFSFDDIASGQNYTIEVRAKGYVFAPRLIAVNDDITGLELSPEP